MKLAVLKERRSGEARVAATPESVKKLKALGIDILVESGAGAGARISDNDFEAAGAVVTPDAGQMLAEADIVLSVRGPGEADDAERKLASGLLAELRRRFSAPPLYARIDMVRGPGGEPVLLELEASEPTLYLAAFVWENRLVFEPNVTRILLLGALLVVLMSWRPQGLLGTARVEIV